MLIYAVLLSTWRSSDKADCFDDLEEIFESYTDALTYVNKRVVDLYNDLEEYKDLAYIEELSLDDKGREIHSVVLELGGGKYYCKWTIVAKEVNKKN